MKFNVLGLKRLTGRSRRTAWLALALGLSGCDLGSESLVRVHGTVTRNGKPVPHLFLNFVPAKGRPSWGISDPQGRFVLHYDRRRDGAVVGRHTVFVTFKPYSPRDDDRRLPPPDDLRPILASYGRPETSPLRVDVESDHQAIALSLD
jgi:hypothetical protein